MLQAWYVQGMGLSSKKKYETDLEAWKCDFLFSCDPDIPGLWFKI